uniref:Interleukin 17 receptor D n=1 Tax=Eptatretus burgeri TaxID=7764 RepID=A0A8C4NJX0_EPTBU
MPPVLLISSFVLLLLLSRDSASARRTSCLRACLHTSPRAVCVVRCLERTRRSVELPLITIPSIYNTTRACSVWSCSHTSGRSCKIGLWSPIDLRISPVDRRQLVDIASDAVLVSWKPDPLGIELVQGYQIRLQGLRGDFGYSKCEQILLNHSLSEEDVNRVFVYDGFDYLQFGADYTVSVESLPWPPVGSRKQAVVNFTARACEEVLGTGNGECKYDWFPKTVNVTQSGLDLNVTFDLAPPSYQVDSYAVYVGLRPEACGPIGFCTPISENKTAVHMQSNNNLTHGWINLHGMQPGATYVIDVSLNNVDAQRKRIIFTVAPFLSQWSGPLRAISITVPIVAAAAVATIVTLMCRTGQPVEGGYLEFTDEEASEGCSQLAGAPPTRLRPKVFVCYSGRDGPKHTNAVLCFARFLQDAGGCKVSIDLWEQLMISTEGRAGWLRRLLDEADSVIVICSEAMKVYLDRRRRHEAAGATASLPSRSRSRCGLGELFLIAVPLVAEKLEKTGNHVVTSRFDYTTQDAVPLEIHAAPHFSLIGDLPPLLTHLKAPGNSGTARWSEREMAEALVSPSGLALSSAISDTRNYIQQNPDWLRRQCGRRGARRGAAAAADDWFGRKRTQDIRPRTTSSGSMFVVPVVRHMFGDVAGAVPGIDDENSDEGTRNVSKEEVSASQPLLWPHLEIASSFPQALLRDSGIYDAGSQSTEYQVTNSPELCRLSTECNETDSTTGSISSSSGLGEEDVVVPEVMKVQTTDIVSHLTHSHVLHV